MDTLLLEHFAAVSKIAAVRQSRERQQGIDCSQGHLQTTSAGLLFEGPRSLECFFKYTVDTDTQFPIGLSKAMMCFELTPQNSIRFFCGNNIITAPIVPDMDYHAVISYDGITAKAYLNGVSVGVITPDAYVIASAFQMGNGYYPPIGPVYFCRHYNYALSASEVATLYNTGDPAGRVLPANYRGYGDVYHSDFSESADGWHVALTDYVTMTAADGVITISKEDANRNMIIARAHNPYDSRVIDYFVRLEFAEPLPAEVTNISARPFNSIAGVNLTISSDRLSATGTFINSGTKPNGGSLIIFQGLGAVSISVSSIQFTPAVCIAEYLPRNLVASADVIVSDWYDSTKQLPLNDEYLPPLLETAGGYDLTAKGTPKIIYKL